MVVSQLVTAQMLPASTEDDNRYELVEGELVEMSPTGAFHGEVVNLLTEALNRYDAEARRFRIRAGDTGYIFGRNPDTVLVPDISVLT